MFSPHRFAKGTALALVLGAVAAPAAAAAPIGGNATQPPLHKTVVKTVPATANALGPLAYSRQDKQVSPSRPSTLAEPGTVAPITGTGETAGAAAFVAARKLQIAAQDSVAAANTGEGFDWGDAGIGAAGGLVIAMLGVGGGLALSQRRSRTTTTSAAVTG